MIEDDFDRSFMLDDFGTDIRLPDGTNITGIFDNAFQGFGNEFELSSVTPAVLCKTSDVSILKNGDKITISDIAYNVRDTEQDGTGMTQVILKR